MKYIASCSFGKDSLAQIIIAMEKGDPIDEVSQYIGIAADEPKRLARLIPPKQVSLLSKYGITEEMAMEMCKKVGLRSPIYDITSRNGCFFCPNASMREIRHLYYHHPTLWRFLHQLQETPNTSRNCFTRSKTVFDYEKQFKDEERRKQKCSQADFHI